MIRTRLYTVLLVAVLCLCKLAVAETQPAAPREPTPYKFGIRAYMGIPALPQDNQLTNEGVALGERLFFERMLSTDSTINCAHCHVPSAAFSDPGRRESIGVDGQRGRRNSMSLENLAWRRGYFWDGRAKTLREQVLHPIADAKEMNLDPSFAAARLASDPGYRAQFYAAFNDKPTTRTLSLALEQFLLVQISQDSKYDKVTRGEAAFNAEETLGRDLFFGERDPGHGLYGADCFHCHGTSQFTNERYADNGIGCMDADMGRYEVTKKQWDQGLFKVPSLRNVALTAPYMHDGRMQSLEQVLGHYSEHVGQTKNLDANLAKHDGQLDLTREEKDALISFLKTLTDDDFVARGKALEKKYGEPPPAAPVAADGPRRPPPPPRRRLGAGE